MHIGFKTSRSLIVLLGFVGVSLVGCGPRDEIEAYNVPKEAPPVVRAAAPPGAPTTPAMAADRMLAGALPEGDRAWFFKVTGPVVEIDAQAAKIEEFLTTIRPAAGKPHPDWKLPAGWQELPASQMRAATLLIPAGAKPLELSVTVLPWAGGEQAMLGNVNRWRGQMQLPPTDLAGLAESTREIKAGDATLTLVDLRGKMSGGMMPPFAGGAMPQAAPAASAALQPPVTSASELPAGHPAVSAQTPANATAPFNFDAPAGWQQQPASGMRKADFLIEAGGKTARATAIDFPASSPPMMSDPVANVRRWRGEVGLPPLSDDEIKKTIQPLQIDGAEAMWVEVVPDGAQPDQSQSDRGTLAAMLKRGDAIWFFKLSGDREVVAAQREEFQSFLKSLKFTGAGGANDGNQ
jgi:hypothetical protein